MIRSYYTTPLFVLVALISIFVIVKNHNIQNEVISIEKDYLHNSFSINRNLVDEIKELRSLNTVNHIKTPDSVRTIYVSSWVASSKILRTKLLNFAINSEINSVTIDIKDSTGVITFPIDNAVINAHYDSGSRVRDIEEFIEELHANDIYVIGRLTTFQDPALAKKHPELAFKRIDNGEVWKDKKGLAFINPKKKKSWEYLIEIAKESYSIGFDEINFDYIRYPSDGAISNINYELNNDETRGSVLKEFYAYLDTELREKNIPISADVFGLITTAKDDVGIGQIFEDILPHFDAIAPMVYPSHYSAGFFGYDNPDANPYGVIYRSMESAKERAIAINEDPQKLRAWIQDFSLGVTYSEKEIRDQIRAVYDLGLDSYMVWDPKNKYTKEAYYNNIKNTDD